MTYSGALWRTMRTRHRLKRKGLRGITPLLLLLLVFWWVAVTVYYPFYAAGRVVLWAIRWERWKAKRHARKAEREARRAKRNPNE